MGCDCTGFMALGKLNTPDEINDIYGFKMTDKARKASRDSRITTTPEEELLSWSQIFGDYQRLKRYCDIQGVLLMDLTEGGLLTNFPKMKYLDVVRNV